MMDKLKISLTYNLKQSDDQPNEFIEQEYVDRVREAISCLGHDVTLVEVTGPPDEVVDHILDSEPQLIFNLAEGASSKGREAYYPSMFEILDIPYTGGGPAIMYVNLDKRLTLKLLEVSGINVSRGRLVTSADDPLPDDIKFPVFIKPNYEGSSLGIGRDSIAHDRDEAEERIEKLLREFEEGLTVEEFIQGRELTVPMLEAYPGQILEIVEYEKKTGNDNILGYETKKADDKDEVLDIHCPADLEPVQRRAVLDMARKTFDLMRTADFGRVDLRLSEDGVPYLIEVTALPGLKPISPMITAARAEGLSYNDVVEHIIRSAVNRYFVNPAR